MKNRFVALIIMDGLGERESKECNAVAIQGTPNLKKLREQYPFALIGASGLDVGLPEGQMGNSEVGHLNIGAGRIVYQDITRIDKAIKDGEFFENPVLKGAMENAKANNSKLHLIGLLSDGGVHSHINHLFALLEMAKMNGLEKVYVHALMDGRDVSPTSGVGFLAQTQQKLKELGIGKIASVAGRYYFMDRDNRWERVEKAFNSITAGKYKKVQDPIKAVEESYANGVTDEFIEPFAVVDENGCYDGQVEAGDSVIYYNFRADRAREGTKAFITKDFDKFERAKGFLPLYFVQMTEYDATFTGLHTAYAPKELKNTLGEYLADLGYTQLRIAETEKYAHVTFFFNGGVETPNKNERRILIHSPKVATYDLKPEMSAYEVLDAALQHIDSGEIDVMILNFANCDMVGHSGNLEATIKAVATVDECVGKLVEKIRSIGGAAIITADHGNAEQLCYEDGSPCTAHTTNPVPCILVDDTRKDIKLRSGGKLCDLAPTLLKILGEKIPEEMEGSPLF
ncbi:MAG TPA: 2,3-bisphosphoglycerate-independent phosphoglycerate mutase [Clostridia bacterium]